MISYRTNGIIIKSNDPRFSSIKQNLNRTVMGFTGVPNHMTFYEEVNNDILIPRYFPIDNVEDKSCEGDDIEVVSNLIPRNERQEKVINYMLTNNCGVIRLEPGSGKTCISVDVLSKIGKRAIIFVHKKSLREQWIEEILHFTNLKKEDIGVLNSATFEDDLKKPLIISTVQGFCSLLKNKHLKKFRKLLDKSGIGVAVFDEVHMAIGPQEFTKCSLSLNCRRVYGLSATPTRADGNDDIITYHLGKVKYYKPEEDELLRPIVYMMYFPFKVYSAHKKYLHWGGGFLVPKYYQQMFKSSKYNDTVSNIIKQLHEKGRTILTLGIRTTALLAIAETCKLSRSEVGIFIPTAINDKKYHKQVDLISDTRDLDEAFKKKRVVFSTFNAARDGNNRKSLDTLVMSVPTGNIEQAAGRVLRTLEGKKTPYVIDLIDTEGPIVNQNGEKVPWFIRSANKRKEFYAEKDWIVKEFWLD